MIATEIEATFLDIDKDNLREKLRAAGAELVQEETLMRRTIFNIDERSFARVRDEGNRITMSYKHLDTHTLSGMQEVCLEVNDFTAACDFIKALGLKPKAEQETYREAWKLGEVEIDIDTWPWLPTYVEIEGPSETEVTAVAEKLGFDMKDSVYGSVDEVFRVYYDTTAHDINYCPEIKFTEVPEWLEAKRRETPLTIAELKATAE